MPSFTLAPEAITSLKDGFASRDKWLMLFVVAISVFVGMAITSLLWYVSNGDQTKNTINTAIGCGILVAAIGLFLIYKWLDWEVGRPVVAMVANHTAELLEVFVVLLITSLINEGWEFGTAANVIASAVPIIIIIVVYFLFKGVRDYQIRHSAADLHNKHFPELLPSESLETVDAWISHTERLQPIYPILPSFTTSTTPTAGPPPGKKRKKTKKHYYVSVS